MTDADHHARQTPAGTAAMLIAVFAGALLVTVGLRVPGFVHHDTSEVVMWGHSGFAAGFWKHPPLLPWITRAWSHLLPMGAFGLSLLTALNMTVAAWAVWRIALMARDDRDADPRIGVVAVLLLAAVPFANGMAVKLNHNTVLISLWPLASLAFLRALDRPTALRGVMFGLAAAAAMLAKYYSGLLLAAFVVASFATPRRARLFYRSPAPYVAIAAFLLATAPHIAWLIDARASSLTYAFGDGSPPEPGAQRGAAMALSFAVQVPLILTPLAIAAWLLGRYAGPATTGSAHRFERELLLIAIIPYVATVAMTVVFALRGATAWAMPIFLGLPAVVAARLGVLPMPRLRRAAVVAAGLALVLAAAGQIGLRIALARGADGISDPRRDIATAATAQWRRVTGKPLAIVGGDARLTSAAVVFSPDHPQGWPGLDARQAPWIDAAAARRAGFVGLCRSADASCLATVRTAAGPGALECRLVRQVRHLGVTGRPFEATVVIVPPAGAQAPPASACDAG